MEDFSVLDKIESPHTDAPRPAFYLDLNVNQIIDKVTTGWSSQVKKLYLYFPRNEECEAYRRGVYGDIKKQACYECLCEFFEKAGEMETNLKQKEAVGSPLQRFVWHLWAIRHYCEAFETLHGKLREIDLTSEGMQEFQKRLEEHLTSKTYGDMRREVFELLDELMSFRFVITYEKDRISVAEGTTAGDYETFVEKGGDKDRITLRSPFLVSPNLSDLENECLKVLATKRPKLFSSLEKVAEKYETYGEAFAFRFIKEIPYYLSYRAFQLDMEEKGFHFCTPTADPESPMEADGLYDLALAIVAHREGRKVISNHMDYGPSESFFVLTGPNQGGKTTFARSLGQLIFFTKMGVDVPADKANVHYFKSILTHFSVEESIETGRGKLKEELLRLAPMMEDREENAFVVINELFTTAATYDAEIMGRKVLEHFIGQNCRGIYVTHLKELAGVHPKVVSLRAMLNEARLQTFEIARSEAEESACAANLVNKYRLTYEQLKERL
ncbi:MAG: hypothetical protein IKS85_04695 [Lachnospiraceae bacterium]|nr:hypothetical protein [Lachnospiraceae bacterium]